MNRYGGGGGGDGRREVSDIAPETEQTKSSNFQQHQSDGLTTKSA